MNTKLKGLILLLLFFIWIEKIFSQEGLPIIEIETVDNEIPSCQYISAPEGCIGNGITDNNYVSGTITVKDNDSTVYKDKMKIKIKGNSSAYNFIKSYKVKLDENYDLLNRNDEAYKNKEWLLLNDAISLNTVVGLKINEIVGIEWTPKYKFVDFIMNEKYIGCYILTESISKGEKKCNIQNNGYLIENDAYWWNADDIYFKTDLQLKDNWFGFTYKYPDPDDVTDSITNNIKTFLTDFEKNLNNQNGNYSEYIDIKTFAAWILGHDILGTMDRGGSNMFLYKEDFDINNPTSTKLKFGPMWDFSSIYTNTNTWSNHQNSLYISDLLQKDDFINAYKSIWDKISPNLYNEIMNYLDSINNNSGEAINESRNKISNKYNCQIPDIQYDINEADIWFRDRINWLENAIALMGLTGSDIIFSSELAISNINIYDIYGRLIYTCQNIDSGNPNFNNLQRGLYLISITYTNGQTISSKFIKK